MQSLKLKSLATLGIRSSNLAAIAKTIIKLVSVKYISFIGPVSDYFDMGYM